MICGEKGKIGRKETEGIREKGGRETRGQKRTAAPVRGGRMLVDEEKKGGEVAGNGRDQVKKDCGFPGPAVGIIKRSGEVKKK